MHRCTSELRLQYLDSVFDDVMGKQDLSDFTRVIEAFRAAISLGECVSITKTFHLVRISLTKAWFKSTALE